ncbi:hypothetical protein ABT275_21685 [Streptomyces sp. NPDC001185]|uniref:hypothetical protein n=1 Tax=Streptomyces sp. NPDC001185 TaxID=3154380 RepID=UPI0033271036
MTSQSAATLRSRYVEQAASDLEENRRRQQELGEKIAMLKQEEALLIDIMTLAERYRGLSDPSHLPEQAHAEPALGPERVDTSSSSGVSPSRVTSPTSRSPRAGRAAAGTKGRSRAPLLGEVLMDLLRAGDEPRLAKELRDELLEKHPDRTPTPQVVRNTLESLVAKGRVQRHRRQRSVMYTVRRPVVPDPSAAGTDTD